MEISPQKSVTLVEKSMAEVESRTFNLRKKTVGANAQGSPARMPSDQLSRDSLREETLEESKADPDEQANFADIAVQNLNHLRAQGSYQSLGLASSFRTTVRSAYKPTPQEV